MLGFCISETNIEAFWEGGIWHRTALCPARGNKERGRCQTLLVSPPPRGSLRQAASRGQPSPPATPAQQAATEGLALMRA